jgi:hypothetical protein
LIDRGIIFLYYPLITERYNMIKDKTFRITYTKSTGEEITRFGKFDDKSRYWVSKVGKALLTYFDLDAKGYRTASGSWKVRY